MHWAELRKRLGMTQKQLAAATGVLQSEISRLENGDCRFSLIRKIVEAIDPEFTLIIGIKMKGEHFFLYKTGDDDPNKTKPTTK